MSPSSILSLILFSSFLVYSSLAATDTELSILLSLKNSIKIPTNDSQTFSSWSSTNSKCSFNGVTCNSNSSVSSIYLNGLGITGTIRFDSLCELPSLTNLSLGANGLTGTLNGVQNCMSLLTLDLSFNEFNGTVPDLSPLKNLRILNISDNSFTGPFPWDSLGNLTELLVLSLGDNSFDQIDTFPSKILNLTKLYWLYLSDTNIGGKIPPEIGNLTELQDLELADNFFFGEIPSEITKLTKLYQLELYNNSLTGTIPPGFGTTLTNLAYFDASMNNLQGNLSELRSLTNIISLQLFYNNFSGEIPPEFGDFKFLVNLSLYSNRLTGQLPQKIGSWAEFNFIDVSTNYLTGSIPPDMCKKGTMIKLLILENQFTGEIPINYANCSSLTRFRVNNNSLTGTVPAGIWGLPNVNIIDLSINNFEGEITADISRAKNLYQLYLGNNKFSGKIPLEISNANSIVNIDISFNNISGEIPETIGELEDLVTLDLQGNKITGIIPNSIGTCSSLNTINLSQNNLSGQIPSSLGQLTRLNSLDLSSNQLTGEIPSTLSSLKLSSLSLANNQLSGPVPASLSIDAYSSSFSGNPNLCLNNKLGFLKSCSGIRTKSSDRVRTVLTCVISVIAVILALIGLYIVIKRTTRSKTKENNPYFKKKGSWDLKSFRVLRVDEREIIEEIKEENLIGRGMSGNVYRVTLGSGVEVAVKHIVSDEESANGEATRGSASGTDAMLGNGNRSASVRCREFEAEVGTLSSIRHVNVVNLYCSITSDDSNSNLLVYEYLPNGSLYDKLHTSQKSILDWETRFDIAVGSARGLEYLHHGCERMILHRDVKSSNILLDEWFKPRIADFGLAKILKMGSGRDGEVSRGVITGTHGYIAPEYAYNWWKVNEKSDVYSFGVVLLELITGKKPIETEFGQNKDIVYWVSQKVDSKDKIMDLIDSRIKESWAREEAIKVLSIAVMCTARVPSVRPSMRRVVQLLEEVANCRTFVGITCERNTKVDQVKLSP